MQLSASAYKQILDSIDMADFVGAGSGVLCAFEHISAAKLGMLTHIPTICVDMMRVSTIAWIQSRFSGSKDRPLYP